MKGKFSTISPRIADFVCRAVWDDMQTLHADDLDIQLLVNGKEFDVQKVIDEIYEGFESCVKERCAELVQDELHKLTLTIDQIRDKVADAFFDNCGINIDYDGSED